jgi:hypothetical protein
MANVKISELPQASVLSQDTIIPIVSGSTTYKVNLEDLNIIEKTKAEIDTLVGSNNLIPGQLYKITGVDTDLYGGTDILIKAATTNKLELAGHGIFYNPKYLNSQATPNNGYGIWSNYITLTMSSIVGTFTNGDTVTANNGATATYLANGFLQWISGNWSAATSISNGSGATANVTGGVSPSYTIGQDVIWGGKHWTNVTGNIGTATDKYTLSADWTVVPFNDVDYNVEIDVVHYDYIHDMIIRRKDKWNNDVDSNFQVFTEFSSPDGYDYGNPIKDFQWGNYPEDFNTTDYWYLGVVGNYVKDSYLECINFIGTNLANNILTNLSYFYGNITDVSSTININELHNYCKIELNVCNYYGTIRSNIEYDGCSIRNNYISNGYIGNNYMNNASYIEDNKLNTNGSISSNKLDFSKIENNQLDNNSVIYLNTLQWSSYITDIKLSNDSRLGENFLNSTSFDFRNTGIISLKYIQYIEAIGASGPYPSDATTATIIYSNYPKQMFKLPNGTTRLGYYNNSSVFTVVNVNA